MDVTKTTFSSLQTRKKDVRHAKIIQAIPFACIYSFDFSSRLSYRHQQIKGLKKTRRMAFAIGFYQEYSTKKKRYSAVKAALNYPAQQGWHSSHKAKTQFNTYVLEYKTIFNVFTSGEIVNKFSFRSRLKKKKVGRAQPDTRSIYPAFHSLWHSVVARDVRRKRGHVNTHPLTHLRQWFHIQQLTDLDLILTFPITQEILFIQNFMF